MPTDRPFFHVARWGVVALLPMLAACQTDLAAVGKDPKSEFGDANRQTMMAQVIDPDPQYDTLTPATSAEHAAQAIERYKADKVKQPPKVSSTQSIGSGGGGK